MVLRFLLDYAQIYADTKFGTRTNFVELKKEIKMGIQNWSEDIILVDLHREPQMGDELKTTIDIVHDRGDCDVILDFSNVDIITSPSLSKLLKLRKLLDDCGHRLVFCSIPAFTRNAFKVTGLDGFFEVVDDRSAASATLQCQLADEADFSEYS